MIANQNNKIQQVSQMLMTYNLSIYDVRFISVSPPPLHYLRLINQHSFNSVDSPPISADNQNQYPILVNIKGQQNMLVKIKVIQQVKGKDIVMGEGIGRIGRQSIDTTLRVVAYSKNQNEEEVAVCSIDIFITGFIIDKQTILNNKSHHSFSKSKSIDFQRDHINLSFTIDQSDKSSSKINKLHNNVLSYQNPIQSNPNAIKLNKIVSPQPNCQSQSVNSSQKHKNTKQRQKYWKECEDNIISNDKNRKNFLKNTVPANQNNLLYGDDEDSQKDMYILEDIMKNERLMKKIKEFLGRQIQKNSQFKQQSDNGRASFNRSKIRRKAYTISQPNPPLSQFIQYFEKVELNSAKAITNIHSYRIAQNQIKDNSKEQIIEMKISNLFFNIKDKQKLVEINYDKYEKSAFYQQNKNTMNQIKINLPASYPFLDFEIETQNKEKFIGTVGLQQGMDMWINLQRKHPNQFQQILLKEEFKMKFDIIGSQSQIQTSIVKKRNEENEQKESEELSYLGPQQFRKIISERSMQPWAFFNSNKLHKNSQNTENAPKQVNQESPQKHSNQLKLPSLQKSNRSPGQIKWKSKSASTSPMKQKQQIQENQEIFHQKKELKPSKNHNKKINKSNLTLTQNKFDAKEHNFIVKKFYTSNQNTQQEQQNGKKSKKKIADLKLKKGGKSKQTLSKAYQTSHDTEFEDIKNIRNGNRMNIGNQNVNPHTVKKLWNKLMGSRVEIKQKQTENIKDRIRSNSLSDVDQTHKKKIETKKASHQRHHHHHQNHQQILIKSPKFVQVPQRSTLNSSSQPLASPKIYTLLNQQKYGPLDSDTTPPTIGLPSVAKPLLPPHNYTLQLNNLSITDDEMKRIIDVSMLDANGVVLGKFTKLFVKGVASYYTQVIFNRQLQRSILWRLQGCIFNNLDGSEKLQLEIYSTENNHIRIIGAARISINKLVFLKQNHLYNGKLATQHEINGEFTLGFQINEFSPPFETIDQEVEYEGMTSRKSRKSTIEAKANTKRYKSSERNHQKKKEFIQKRQFIVE